MQLTKCKILHNLETQARPQSYSRVLSHFKYLGLSFLGEIQEQGQLIACNSRARGATIFSPNSVEREINDLVWKTVATDQHLLVNKQHW